MDLRLHDKFGLGLALALAFLVVGGCGVNSADEFPAFEVTGVGPEGGSVAAGDVELVIPPGALTELTQISILPQEDPFPIAVQDPCTYSFLGPLWCVGPVGHDLAQFASIRVHYDPGLIPPPFTASDLVLFLWDDNIEAFVLLPGVIHNVALSYFEFLSLDELGHVAVGIRDCPALFGQIVLGAGNPPFQGGLIGPDGGTQGEGPYPGLYLVDMDDPVPTPVVLNTLHDPFATPPEAFFAPSEFIPSPDGTRVLYDAAGQFENSLWKTVLLDPIATSVVVASNPDQNIQGVSYPFGDPFVGWLIDPPAPPQDPFTASTTGPPSAFDVYFRERVDPIIDSMTASVSGGGTNQALVPVEWISRRPAHVESNQAPGSSQIWSWTAFSFQQFGGHQFIDMRQSPDGQHLIVFVQDTDNQKPSDVGSGRYDVINVPGSSLVSSGQIPIGSFNGGGIFIPRFTPDSQYLYQVDSDQQGVTRYDLDSTNPTVLWAPDLSALDTPEILDFVLSPNGTRFAALVRDVENSEDYLYFGIPGSPGSELESYFFDDQFEYREVVFHPDGDVLYVDCSFFGKGFDWSVVPFTLDETQAPGSRIFEHPELMASGIERLDINSQDGRLLQVEGSPFDYFDVQAVTDGQQSPAPLTNVYVSDKFGGNIVGVPLPTGLNGENARWAFTIRRAPGMIDHSISVPGNITPGVR